MIKRIWYPTLRRSGLPIYRFHLLRHTNASLRIEAGQNIKYLSVQLVIVRYKLPWIYTATS